MPETSYAQDMASSVADDIEVDVEDFDDAASVAESNAGRSGERKVSKNAKVKKRGTIFQCESCSKVRSITYLHFFRELFLTQCLFLGLQTPILPGETSLGTLTALA